MATKNTIAIKELELKKQDLEEKRRSNLANESIKQREVQNAIRKTKQDWLLGLSENEIKRLANDQLNVRELQKIAETVRSNLAKEQENFRSNTADEAERYRHNVATENLGKLEIDLRSDLNDQTNRTNTRNTLINILGSMARGLGTAVLGYVVGKNSGGKDKPDKGSAGDNYTVVSGMWDRIMPRTESFTINDLWNGAELSALITGLFGTPVFASSGGDPGNDKSQKSVSFNRNEAYKRRMTNTKNLKKSRFIERDDENEIPNDFSNSYGPMGGKHETIVNKGSANEKSGPGYKNPNQSSSNNFDQPGSNNSKGTSKIIWSGGTGYGPGFS